MPPKIILCAPRHKNDNLTGFFNAIADGIGGPNKNIVRPVIEMPTTYSELAASLSLPDDCILIFAGHGDEDALLGPAKDKSPDMSTFYDSTMFHLGPRSLLAFCCDSGERLGPEFKKLNSRTFLGFSKKIGFVLLEGKYTDWSKKIFHSLASQVISDEKVSPKIRKIAEEVYKEAYNYFKYGEGSKHEFAPLMATFLHNQKEDLCILTE